MVRQHSALHAHHVWGHALVPTPGITQRICTLLHQLMAARIRDDGLLDNLLQECSVSEKRQQGGDIKKSALVKECPPSTLHARGNHRKRMCCKADVFGDHSI
eukprot:1161840-Pelagomonas_calceolata.AAC.26